MASDQSCKLSKMIVHTSYLDKWAAKVVENRCWSKTILGHLWNVYAVSVNHSVWNGPGQSNGGSRLICWFESPNYALLWLALRLRCWIIANIIILLKKKKNYDTSTHACILVVSLFLYTKNKLLISQTILSLMYPWVTIVLGSPPPICCRRQEQRMPVQSNQPLKGLECD